MIKKLAVLLIALSLGACTAASAVPGNGDRSQSHPCGHQCAQCKCQHCKKDHCDCAHSKGAGKICDMKESGQ